MIIPKDKGSSETIRADCSFSNINLRSRNSHKKKDYFSYWISGIIDADPCLLVSKDGFCSCEITLGEHQYIILQTIKERLGGSIKHRLSSKVFRWRLHKTPGMLFLVSHINGKLLLQKSQKQLEKVCMALKISPKAFESFSIENSWLTGFFEGAGHIKVNSRTFQCCLSISQKDFSLLKEISKDLGGIISFDKAWNCWVYRASSLLDIRAWLVYFSRFPMRSLNVKLIALKKILFYKTQKVHLRKTGKPYKRFKTLVSKMKGG